MSRSLYSLILSDDVVAAIDRLAVKRNQSRSALIDRLLAEALSMHTGEQQIEQVFQHMESLFADLEPFSLEPSARCTMRLKTNLACKYQPTLRYEVRLFPSVQDHAVGRLNVQFRSRSEALLLAADRFFRALIQLEDRYIRPFYPPGALRYTLETGRFSRTLPLRSEENWSEAALSSSLSAYIQMVDALFKKSLTEGFTPEALERAYVSCLDRAGDLFAL